MRTSLLLAAFAAAALFACEGASDPGGSAGSFSAPDGSFDGATTESPDASAADAADAADAGDPARAAELAKMQAHLDSLYAQSDVVHRFTTTLGDKVDCVPFQRQPGFSRVNSLNGAMPLDMYFPPAFAASGSEAGLGSGVDADGNTRGCPTGSVPIRHIELSDLAGFDTLAHFLAKGSGNPLSASESVLHEHAVYMQLSTPNWGAQTTLNLWSPAVEPDDFSLSQMWIVDSTASAQTAEAGYVQYPSKLGAGPRLFIYSTADSYNNADNSDCYNLACKSFIQLADSHVLLGGQFDKSSVLNGEQRVFRLRYQYCPASQCKDWEGWWLHYEGGTLNEWIGFYPSKRYGSGALHDGSGTRTDFGGEIFFPTPGKQHTTTDMGSGQPPAGGFGVAAYQTDLLSITTENSWKAYSDLEAAPEKPLCYDDGALIAAASALGAGNRIPSSMFYFGGTGQSAACP